MELSLGFGLQTNFPQAASLAPRRSGYINHAVGRKGHVRYWHLADMPRALTNVCYWGQSGH
jgi:hypothetical protein